MTVQDLLSALAKIQAVHGPDVEVWTTGDDYGFMEVESVDFKTAAELPQRIGHPVVLLWP